MKIKNIDKLNWWELAIKATESSCKEEKTLLFTKSCERNPIESWPLIHLAGLKNDEAEIISLLLRSIKIDNSICSYIKIFEIMSKLGFKHELINEIEKIDFSLIKEETIKNNLFSIKNSEIKELKNKDEIIKELINEFIKISNINKRYITIKGPVIKTKESFLLEYRILDGRIIFNEKNFQFNKKYFSKINEHHYFDFIVDNNCNLFIGQEHAFLSKNNSVQAVGMMGIDENGAIFSLNNWSGHYRPKVEECDDFVEILESFGINLTTAEVNFKNYENWTDFTSQP